MMKQTVHPTTLMQSNHMNSFHHRRRAGVRRCEDTRRMPTTPSLIPLTFLTSNYPPILKSILCLNPPRAPMMMRRNFVFRLGLVLLPHSCSVWDGPHAPSGEKSQVS